jgi:rhodanese-related sulfurtransferase
VEERRMNKRDLVFAFLPRLIRRLKGPRFTDAATLKDRLEAGEKIALIDVRSASEFFGPLSHIVGAGATNIPIEELSGKIPDLNESKARSIITI